jgi:hypothetical protein
MSGISLIVQYLTNLGLMAAGGSLATYVGGTTTPLSTYTDNTGLVANPNPMTLSSTGRPAAASGAPVAFWTPGGSLVRLLVNDAAGNQLVFLDNIASLNDLTNSTTTLQALLASAASAGGTGFGPVAGADLVANAMKSYDVIADVRAANTPVLVTGQTLTISVQGGTSINDGLGGLFYWNASSSAGDNGATVLKPNTNTGAGRWLRLFAPPLGAVSSIASGGTTDLGTLATNIVTVTGTSGISSFGSSASQGNPLYVVQFASPLTLTQGGPLQLPGGQNLTVGASDAMLLLYLGSGNWIVLGYFPYLGVGITLLKTSDQSVASSTALVDDNTLTIGLAAGYTYLVSVKAMLLGSTGTGQGYKVQLTYGGSLGGVAVGQIAYSSDDTLTTAVLTPNTTYSASAIADTGGDIVYMDIVLQPTTSDTLTLQFAQESSSADATTMKAGSMMTVRALAA